MSDPIVTIAEQVAERIEAEQEHLAPLADQQKKDGNCVDDTDFVMRCLYNNERGDGILYTTVHRGKFVNVKSRDEKAKAWFLWSGYHWEIDKADFHYAGVEDVALIYEREAKNLKPEIEAAIEDLNAANILVARYNKMKKQLVKTEACAAELDTCDQKGRDAESDADAARGLLKNLEAKRKKLRDRCDRLRSNNGAKNCIEWAHKLGPQGLFIYGDEVDQKPMLLPCLNGVIDLETGSLISGDPADYLVRSITVDYTGIDTPCPIWQQTISEIHGDEIEVVEFIQRFFGYCITGDVTEQVYACFIGDGSNGKGIMFEILREILGDLAWSISPEMLMDSRNTANPDGPSPSVMSLQGRRLVLASETDEGRKLSGAAVKRFTGGDTLQGRSLFDKYDINFQPTHKLAMSTNHELRGMTADFALLRRLLYIYYPLRYVDDVKYHQEQEPNNAHLFRPKNPNLKKELQQEKSGILGWLVEGCIKWQQGGLQIPGKLRAAVEELRQREDTVGQYMTTIADTTDPTRAVLFGSLFDHYAKWFSDVHGTGDEKDDKRHRPSKKKFGQILRKKGYHLPDSSSTSGKQYIAGVMFPGATYDDQRTLPGGHMGSGDYDQL
jgi:putative DNA primase/helicase